MNARKLKKEILAEALRLHSHSHRFPVKRFMIHTSTGECSDHEYAGDFAWLNELMDLCRKLSARASHPASR